VINCFHIAGTYELAYKVLGADLFDPATGASKVIEWKKTYIVTPDIVKYVEILPHKFAAHASSSSSTHPPLSLGCESTSWLECNFRDGFGYRDEDQKLETTPEIGTGGSAKKDKGKKGVVAGVVKGNLCAVPGKSVSLEFDNVKPDGMVLEGKREELGDNRLLWNVKITPQLDCANVALKGLQKKAGQTIQGECTVCMSLSHY